jgi:hypothetical protein
MRHETDRGVVRNDCTLSLLELNITVHAIVVVVSLAIVHIEVLLNDMTEHVYEYEGTMYSACDILHVFMFVHQMFNVCMFHVGVSNN